MRSVLGFSGGKAVARINAPANRVAWSSRHRPENHRTRRALIVAVVTGCIAPGLKQLEPSVLMVLKYISILRYDRAIIHSVLHWMRLGNLSPGAKHTTRKKDVRPVSIPGK